MECVQKDTVGTVYSNEINRGPLNNWYRWVYTSNLFIFPVIFIDLSSWSAPMGSNELVETDKGTN